MRVFFTSYTMPNAQNFIEVGWLYKTPQEQDKVVIRVAPDSKVVYASRGVGGRKILLKTE